MKTTPISEMTTQMLNAKSAAISNGISKLQQELNTLEDMQKAVAARRGILAKEAYEAVHIDVTTLDKE